MFLKKNKEKIFCIGLNKTGTTTVEKVLGDFKYSLGIQRDGEILLKKWYSRDFDEIIRLSKTADAFQDIPYSLPYTYIFLQQYFKNAKFILTVRDDPEQWYNSITKFHSKLWGNGKIPNKESLKTAKYRYKGFAYDVVKAMFNTCDNDLYNKKKLIEYYNSHNFSVIEYFSNYSDSLIVINVSDDNDYLKLCNFLNKKPIHEGFPWENKT